MNTANTVGLPDEGHPLYDLCSHLAIRSDPASRDASMFLAYTDPTWVRCVQALHAGLDIPDGWTIRPDGTRLYLKWDMPHEQVMAYTRQSGFTPLRAMYICWDDRPTLPDVPERWYCYRANRYGEGETITVNYPTAQAAVNAAVERVVTAYHNVIERPEP